MLHEYHVIYSIQYYLRFHVTAVGLGTYYRGYRSTPVYQSRSEETVTLAFMYMCKVGIVLCDEIFKDY
jgi:hypothetical protein